jgi:alkylhydroperoxidase family enzyme
MSSVRIPPLPFAEWTNEAHEALAQLGSAATLEVAKKSNLFRTLIHHPKLAKAVYALGAHLLLGSTLSPRLREIVTLRVAWRYKAEYEWYQHVLISKRIGVTGEEIEATRQGAEAAVWSEADRCVLRVADQLCEQSKIDDATWDELSRFLDRSQIMDLVFTVGNYVMLAWALGVFGVEIEPEFRSSEHALS